MAALKHPCVGDLTYGADPTLSQEAGPRAAVAARRAALLRPPRRRPLGGVREPLPGRPAGRAGPDRALVVSLRDLDERLVPRLAVLLRSLLDAVSARSRTAGSAVRSRGAALLTGGGALRRLDERYARSGPLGLVREVPQLGVLLVATVFLAGTGAAVALSGPDEQQPSATRPVRACRRAGASSARSSAPRSTCTSRPPPPCCARPPPASPTRSGWRWSACAPGWPRRPPSTCSARPTSSWSARTCALPCRACRRRSPSRPPATCSATCAPSTRPPPSARPWRSARCGRPPRRSTRPRRPSRSSRPSTRPTPPPPRPSAPRTPPSCPCVFSLVVEGELARLVALLGRGEVRGVEAAPAGLEVTALDLRPLAPSQTGTRRRRPPAAGVSVSVTLAVPADLDEVWALRHEVFVVGQGVPVELERDELDAGADHAVARLGRRRRRDRPAGRRPHRRAGPARPRHARHRRDRRPDGGRRGSPRHRYRPGAPGPARSCAPSSGACPRSSCTPSCTPAASTSGPASRRSARSTSRPGSSTSACGASCEAGVRRARRHRRPARRDRPRPLAAGHQAAAHAGPRHRPRRRHAPGAAARRRRRRRAARARRQRLPRGPRLVPGRARRLDRRAARPGHRARPARRRPPVRPGLGRPERRPVAAHRTRPAPGPAVQRGAHDHRRRRPRHRRPAGGRGRGAVHGLGRAAGAGAVRRRRTCPRTRGW